MTPADRSFSPSLHRILVISNETVEGFVLHEAIVRRICHDGEVLVVAPALNSRVRHWLSDEDPARRGAKTRVERCVELLADAGVRAEGRIGDADPLQAIDDALSVFAADAIIVATHPEERSNWLARDLVIRARESFGLPVVHVVVDLAHSHEYVLEAA